MFHQVEVAFQLLAVVSHSKSVDSKSMVVFGWTSAGDHHHGRGDGHSLSKVQVCPHDKHS